jgi:hypothetical protein
MCTALTVLSIPDSWLPLYWHVDKGTLIPTFNSTVSKEDVEGEEEEDEMYRVIHKSLWDFQPLRYSSQDGHVEGKLVNRERETLQVSVLPYRCSICAPLVMQQISNFGKFQDKDRLIIPCPCHVSSRLPP